MFTQRIPMLGLSHMKDKALYMHIERAHQYRAYAGSIHLKPRGKSAPQVGSPFLLPN